MKHWTLMPGAEVVESDHGGSTERAQLGIPPCMKLWLQRHLPPPTVLVLPDVFFRHGVVQVCAEFFLYHYLFVRGKAYGKLPEDARLTIVGTQEQLRRARRILEVTLFGFTADEMRRWTDLEAYGGQGRRIPDETVHMFRQMRAWFNPKKPGFDQLKTFVEEAWRETAPTLGKTVAAGTLDGRPALVQRFVERYRDHKLDDLRLLAFEFASFQLDDFIEWRPYDQTGRVPLLASGVVLHRQGDNQFVVEDGEQRVSIDLNFGQSQAPWLITLPPSPAPVVADTFEVLCLGSDSGFEMEHPTTGFAICLNGQWAVVDAPVCASYLLSQYGIEARDVRVVVETHGHEDHMGSGIHFLLECLTSGHSYTYVAAEPVYRTCLVKAAAILGVTEEEAEVLLKHGVRDQSAPGAAPRVVRIRPGVPVRLLGATWHFVWMVHPVPTTGFRIELHQPGRTHALAYSSDTAPWRGDLGIQEMVRQGFLDAGYDVMSLLILGNEDLVFWEAGGTNGDPIHFNGREWDEQCHARGLHPPVVFMHAHPMPPELRRHSLARPGMVWSLAPHRTLRPADAVNLTRVLDTFPLLDPSYWLWQFISQGEVMTCLPDTLLVAEGGRADGWYLILQGTADISSKNDYLGTIGGGAFFGELALLDNTTRRASVRSSSPIVLLRIPPDIFREFVVANNLWSFFPKFWQDVALLRQTRLFFGFPHDVVAELARSLEHRHYQRGTVIIEQGTTGRELFVIEKGEVSVHARRDDGSVETVCPTMGAGEIVGEYGVLMPEAQRSATVKAETDVDMLVLAGEHLERLLTGQLPLQLRLVALVRDRGLPLPPIHPQMVR